MECEAHGTLRSYSEVGVLAVDQGAIASISCQRGHVPRLQSPWVPGYNDLSHPMVSLYWAPC